MPRERPQSSTAPYWQAGERARAIEHGEKGIALAERAGDFSVLYTTIQHEETAFNARGEFERQVELHRRVALALSLLPQGTWVYRRPDSAIRSGRIDSLPDVPSRKSGYRPATFPLHV